jgi:hypothetical protein
MALKRLEKALPRLRFGQEKSFSEKFIFNRRKAKQPPAVHRSNPKWMLKSLVLNKR